MNSDPSVPRCPQCAAAIPPDAPQGLCPRCVMLAAAGHTEPGTSAAGAEPPDAAVLARSFPHLEILGLVGRGGMGFVYKVRQPKLGRLAALKILPDDPRLDPQFAGRFHREARALARLNHPGIVAIHDFGVADGFCFLLMEYVDGVNLRQAMDAGRFSPAAALAVVPRICEALQYAHDQGVLHRDIKPENILLDARGHAKIVDFGIAKLVGEESPDRGLTLSGSRLGTPTYMAPEQIEDPSSVDHRADIYSLGVVFYELLTGELPLGRFAPPSAKAELDVRIDEIVMRALAKERELRQQSAGEVKTQCEGVTSSPGPAGPDDPQPRQALPAFLFAPVSARAKPWLLAGILLVAAALVVQTFGIAKGFATLARMSERPLFGGAMDWLAVSGMGALALAVWSRRGRLAVSLGLALPAVPSAPDRWLARGSALLVVGLVVQTSGVLLGVLQMALMPVARGEAAVLHDGAVGFMAAVAWAGTLVVARWKPVGGRAPGPGPGWMPPAAWILLTLGAAGLVIPAIRGLVAIPRLVSESHPSSVAVFFSGLALLGVHRGVRRVATALNWFLIATHLAMFAGFGWLALGKQHYNVIELTNALMMGMGLAETLWFIAAQIALHRADAIAAFGLNPLSRARRAGVFVPSFLVAFLAVAMLPVVAWISRARPAAPSEPVPGSATAQIHPRSDARVHFAEVSRAGSVLVVVLNSEAGAPPHRFGVEFAGTLPTPMRRVVPDGLRLDCLLEPTPAGIKSAIVAGPGQRRLGFQFHDENLAELAREQVQADHVGHSRLLQEPVRIVLFRLQAPGPAKANTGKPGGEFVGTLAFQGIDGPAATRAQSPNP